ncbi:hypothetical protein [Pseudalkalibacillus salsuginis]|uniref:hypothetical protein n=1 Tax=Pseudalkalibacillus salsuginis TaxID=2910972 RepID=UPI001F337388|nr:hypothetical protein [Pseudalkalibacillus salsuginis]MCF6408258.1 hypothetical protein [Pseudalkalibacillus salsuginis]
MFKRIIALLIGYLSLFTVVNDIPTTSYDEFMQWVSSLVLNPFRFVISAFLTLIGVIAYGIMIKTVITDFKHTRAQSWVVGILYCAIVLVSMLSLYHMNQLLIFILLPCSVIYGIISLSQRNVIERGQEGAE